MLSIGLVSDNCSRRLTNGGRIVLSEIVLVLLPRSVCKHCDVVLDQLMTGICMFAFWDVHVCVNYSPMSVRYDVASYFCLFV